MRFKNYINRYNKKNRIYSEEELLAMTLNDLLDNEPSILAQDGDIGIPSYEELRRSPNTRWIDTYTNSQGQKDGGFFGSINDNYYNSFVEQREPFRLEENPQKSHPIKVLSMSEGEPEVEQEEESPIVLEGGVEENVYLPEEDEEQEPEPSVYIPDEEEPEERQKTPYELSDEDLTDILQSIIKAKTTVNTQNEPILENSFPTLPQTDTPNPPPVSLPQIQTSLNQEELKQMYEKLLEELRKMLSRKISNWTNNNIFYGSSANNNKLSILETAKEIGNFQPRQKQKAEIDEYLNDYVERKNIPDEYKNALRHRAGSLLMAKKLGDNDKAQLWGNIKEILDLFSGHDSKIGSAIDAQNNYIGRTIYDKYQNDNLSDDELMDKIIDSIKKYNPGEKNYKDWQNQNSKIPMRKIFEGTNTITRPINKKYHKIEKIIKNNPKT